MKHIRTYRPPDSSTVAGSDVSPDLADVPPAIVTRSGGPLKTWRSSSWRERTAIRIIKERRRRGSNLPP
jgi:hypothetical protein